MKASRLLLIAILAISVAWSQIPPIFNPFAGTKTPQPPKNTLGAWCEYKIKAEEEEASGTMKLSIVDEDKREGKSLYWFELDFKNDEGDRNIVKMLTKSGVLEDKTNYYSVVVKHNDEQALEFEFQIPEEEAESKAQPQKPAEPSSKESEGAETSYPGNRVTIKTETIKVPAGKFKCQHITVEDTVENEKIDLWFTPDVPITGIVKMASDDMEAVLLSYGWQGAKSAITETPKKVSFGKMLIPQTPPEELEEGGEKEEDEEDEDNPKDMLKKGLKSIFGK